MFVQASLAVAWMYISTKSRDRHRHFFSVGSLGSLFRTFFFREEAVIFGYMEMFGYALLELQPIYIFSLSSSVGDSFRVWVGFIKSDKGFCWSSFQILVSCFRN